MSHISQKYFSNDYDGTATDGMKRLSKWIGDTYYTYGLPHYEVPCVSTTQKIFPN